MKIKSEFPFNNYSSYLVINPENRKNVCLIHKITKQRTTTSYARYLMSVKEKRFLNQDEQVDHIDGDKTNDSIENLQILSAKENCIKHTIQKNITRKMVELQCPYCNNIFTKPLNNSFLQKGGKFNCCSKKCLHEFLKIKHSTEELVEIGKNQIVRYFRK